MMKKLTILFVLLTAVLVANAQDIITLKNGNEVRAKVTEISSSEIKYKRFENLDGPTVVIAISDVFAINYENGTREVINPVTQSAPETVRTIPAASAGMNVTTSHAGSFRAGLKAGLNFASMNYTDGKIMTAFGGGFFGQYKFANMAIQPEVLFSMQGSDVEGYSGSAFRLNYISIPIMIQYFVMPGFAIEAGPQLGIMLTGKALGVDVKKYLNTIDFALNVGISYELPNFPLGFFFRYSLGFTGIIKDAKDDAGTNRVMQLGAFFKF
jgi:hypothetical protein